MWGEKVKKKVEGFTVHGSRFKVDGRLSSVADQLIWKVHYPGL